MELFIVGAKITHCAPIHIEVLVENGIVHCAADVGEITPIVG